MRSSLSLRGVVGGALIGMGWLLPVAALAQETFIRGDVNADGLLDVSDPVFSLLYLFTTNATPGCLDAADVNDDGAHDLTDAVSALDFLFRGGPAPPEPFTECGDDPTIDALGCESHAPCASAIDADPEITEWNVPWRSTRPRDPFPDAEGRVWFVGQTGDYVAYLEPVSGEFTRFDLPDGAGPHTVIVGEHVWYSGNRAANIGRLSQDGDDLELFPMPESGARDPHTLVFDSQGTIWFTVQNGNYVGRLEPSSGDVRLARVPTSRAGPYGIIVDRDNRPWFTEFGTNKIASIDRETFEIEEFVLPRSGARPRRIGATSDGLIWYVDYAQGRLGRFDPATEEFREWLLPGGTGARPYGMAVDHRDRIWLVETGSFNRFVGFQPATEEFFSNVPIPSGGGVVRHMQFDLATRSVWFGTDAGTIGRARVE